MLVRRRVKLGAGRGAFIYPDYLDSYLIVEMNNERCFMQ